MSSIQHVIIGHSERVGPLKLINEYHFQGVISVLVLHALKYMYGLIRCIARIYVKRDSCTAVWDRINVLTVPKRLNE